MLAMYLRQDLPILNHHEHQLPTHTHSSPLLHQQQQHSSNSSYPRNQNPQYLPVPSEAEIARLSHSPLSTIESSPATSTLDYEQSKDYYMQRGSNIGNIHTSRRPSLEASNAHPPSWSQSRSTIGTRGYPYPIAGNHKRTNSDSTIQSAPYTPTSFPQQSVHQQPYIVDTDYQYSPHREVYDQNGHSSASITTPKSYPHNSQPLDHSTYYAPEYFQSCYNDAQGHLQYNQALRQALYQQQQVSNFQAQLYRNMEQQGEINGAAMQDKLASFPLSRVLGPRTISAICEDELYNVAEQSIPAPVSTVHSPASPANSVFNQRLQAANQSHLEAQLSPTTSTISRDKSPFRTNSALSGTPYEPPPASPGPIMNTAAHVREFQHAVDAKHALANATRRHSRENSQTVSPKEVSLEYDVPENENTPVMFGNLPTSPGHGQRNKRPSRLNQELTQTPTFENTLKREESSNVSNESVISAAAADSNQIQVPQQYPFIRTQRPSTSAVPESSQESNPRFPATLISMESTRSERSSGIDSPEIKDDSEQEDQFQSEDDDEDTARSEVTRPKNTRIEGGTYTCTYHGCTQRFETPQRLQKHKKEGHRQGTPSSNADSRLTQAGPHKCERLNPQTGKPCNSIFSRPYDLTRHEDTIHNAKKQKVRCQICTEEKLFSRNDALTRHMRVVHPDVDFPGRQKRASR